MKIYNKDKTRELNNYEVDLEKGYLKPDKLFIAHHEAVEAKKAVYTDRPVKYDNGSTSIFKDLVTPAVEAKEAYDEYEDISVYILYTIEEIKENLRKQRDAECFPYINRGQLWYDSLTDKEYSELQHWYADWLDVTETMSVPTKPLWLK